MVYVVQVCLQLASRIKMELCEQNQDGTQFHPDPARKLSAIVYDILYCYVYSGKLLTMDRGTIRNM
jgi:hypothetical protein